MKKFLIILLFAAFSAVSAKAQTVRALTSANAAALVPTIDTVTNTGTKLMTLVTPFSGPKQTTSVSAVCRLISGTGAGTVTLLGSIDGVNYSTIAASQLQGSQTATFTLTNVTNQSYVFVLPNGAFKYFRLNCTGSGTESITISGNVYSVTNN